MADPIGRANSAVRGKEGAQDGPGSETQFARANPGDLAYKRPRAKAPDVTTNQ